jgi:anti-sigma factor RsiW
MTDRSEILNDYLLGELPEDQRRELLSEIEADPVLAAELAELTPLVATLEELPDEAWDDAALPPLQLPGAPAPSPTRQARTSSGVIKRFFSGSFALRPALALVAVLAIFAAGLGLGLHAGGDRSIRPQSARLRSNRAAR